MNKSELITKLKELGYSNEDLKGKQLSELKKIFKEHIETNDLVGDLLGETIEESSESESQDSSGDIPKIGDVAWTPYIIAQLQKNEKYGEHPTLQGLRRVATKVFGKMICSKVFAVQVPGVDNKYRSAVQVTVWPNDHKDMTQSAIGEATFHNTEEPYSDYPLAVSESRAEGRALKKLLCISCTTHEEAGLSGGLRSPAPDTMINGIRLLASKNGVDIEKMCAATFPDLEGIDSLDLGQAHRLREQILDTNKKEKTK